MGIIQKAGLFIWLGSVAAQAWGLDLNQKVQLNIPAQRLDSALVQFSEQAKVQVTSSANEVRNLSTSGLVGSYKISDALIKLLENSGLSFRAVGESAISIGKFAR